MKIVFLILVLTILFPILIWGIFELLKMFYEEIIEWLRERQEKKNELKEKLECLNEKIISLEDYLKIYFTKETKYMKRR